MRARIAIFITSSGGIPRKKATIPEMSPKTVDRLYAVSLILIGVSSALLAALALFGKEVPDAFRRIAGIICLVSLPVLVYTSFKKFMSKYNGRKKDSAAVDGTGNS